ncbi:MAG: hypothetical protein U0166_05785 [Acidobacteriota bacterium]
MRRSITARFFVREDGARWPVNDGGSAPRRRAGHAQVEPVLLEAVMVQKIQFLQASFIADSFLGASGCSCREGECLRHVPGFVARWSTARGAARVRERPAVRPGRRA